jgi:hypothetical protein
LLAPLITRAWGAHVRSGSIGPTTRTCDRRLNWSGLWTCRRRPLFRTLLSALDLTLLAFEAILPPALLAWTGAYVRSRSLGPATRGYDRRLRGRGLWSSRWRCYPLRIVLSALDLALLAAFKALLLTFKLTLLPIWTHGSVLRRRSLQAVGTLLTLRSLLTLQTLHGL